MLIEDTDRDLAFRLNCVVHIKGQWDALAPPGRTLKHTGNDRSGVVAAIK